MKLKKLDRLLITSFIPPLIVTFFIALFVFVMQTLWLYMDDIAGKGVGFFLMVELVGYMSVSMIPLALPVAVLISSVMVLGNMAERYELSSCKSAGISLWRVMKPLMFITLCIGLFSFFCSNYFIPVSNLKFKSRLHDIKNQKPALSLEESVFNNDFQGFSIRLGDKLPDGRTIRDVIVYDNKEANQGRLTMVAADSGLMYGSKDGKYFVLHLFEGNQYAEPKPVTKDGGRTFPMMRASFREWTKVFDLDEFEIDRTDENLFKSHHTMLSNRQLLIAIDSINEEIRSRVARIEEATNRHYYFWDKAFEEKRREESRKEAEERRAKMAAERDSMLRIGQEPPQPKYLSVDTTPRNDAIKVEEEQIRREKQRIKPSPQAPSKPFLKPSTDNQPTTDASKSPKKTSPPLIKPSPAHQEAQTFPLKPPPLPPIDPYAQTIEGRLEDVKSILATFPPEKHQELLEKAKSAARSIKDQAENTQKSLQRTRESRVKHVYEFFSKFSLALACFIFLFIGAPMGAIVRKGGFGWPLLISIVFFMLFIVIGIFSKNIAERAVIDAVLASWMNCLVVFPMGLVLTYWAMRDIGLTQLADIFRIKIPVLKKGK